MKEKSKKLAKGILLYATLLYFALFAMGVESLTEVYPLAGFVSFIVLLILLVLCRIFFKGEDLTDYIPKWFK